MEKIIVNKNNNKNIFLTYWNKIKEHTKNIYSSKYWIYKIIAFSITAMIVLGISFGVRESILNSEIQSKDLIPNFLKMHIIGNTGIAFSNLSNSSVSFIFFIQIFPIIIMFIAIIFTKSIAIDIGLTMAIAGGLSNVIDRGVYDNYRYLSSIDSQYAVVDYLTFSFLPNSAIFNLPDVFVILGIIEIGIYIIYYYVKTYIDEKKKKEKEIHTSGKQKN